MNRLRYTALIATLLIFAVIAGVPAAAADTTTVILVRHAEKMTDSSDPELSEAGVARAAALVRVLADVKLSAIFSTPFKRTTETVAAIGAERGIDVVITAIEEGLEKHVADVVRRVTQDHPGETVLVVGHSNTVPAILGGLGIHGAPALSEKDYDDLFVVTIEADGSAQLMHLHYGAVSP